MNRYPKIDYSQHPAYKAGYQEKGKFPWLGWSREFVRQLFIYLKLKKYRENFDFLPDGIQVFEVNTSDIRTILNPLIQEIKNKKSRIEPAKRKFRDKLNRLQGKCALKCEGCPHYEIIYALVDEILKTNKVYEIAKNYRYPVKISQIFLMVSDATDEDYKNHYQDLGLADPPTVYFHTDSSQKKVKCLLYLNEVTKDNGPFSYVLRSNQAKVTMFDYLVRKTNDVLKFERTEPKFRRIFAAMPKFLQRKNEFGNDLGMNDRIEEQQITSLEGNLILFDTDGIHRGGMVQQGERYMLQIELEHV